MQYQKADNSADGFSIQATHEEAEVLKELADRKDSYTLSYKATNGDVFIATPAGKLSYEAFDANTQRASGVRLVPDEKWTRIAAG